MVRPVDARNNHLKQSIRHPGWCASAQARKDRKRNAENEGNAGNKSEKNAKRTRTDWNSSQRHWFLADFYGSAKREIVWCTINLLHALIPNSFCLFLFGWGIRLPLMIVHMSHFVMKLMFLTCASCYHACILDRFGLAEFSIWTIKSGLHAPFHTIIQYKRQFINITEVYWLRGELSNMIKECSQ